MNTQSDLRPGTVIDGDTVVGQLPDGDWLLMAPASTFRRLEWGCCGERIGADGTGRENTDKLLEAGSPAAAYCRTGLNKPYDLPSLDELGLLYRRRAALDLSEATWALSSTEYSSLLSWNQSFSDGYQNIIAKSIEYWVVPVRRVSPIHFSAGKAARLREQRDELLEALEETLAASIGWYETATKSDDASELGFVIRARSAIAKAKGCEV